MRIINYVGADGDTIVIESPKDLYPLLDWFHTKIIDLGSSTEDLQKVSKIMDLVSAEGLGDFDDIDSISYE